MSKPDQSYVTTRRFRLFSEIRYVTHVEKKHIGRGVVFSDGAVALRTYEYRETRVYENLGIFEHAEGVTAGRTKVEWEDPICFQCAATLEIATYVMHCFGCGAGQGKDKPFNERDPDPELGTWSPTIKIDGGPHV